MNELSAVLAALVGAPALPGARCRGRSALFDERGPTEHPDIAAQRHAQALILCGHCPALEDCRTWFDALPPSKKPAGITAGRVHCPRSPGRPRKDPRTA